jgi:curved DNA-binding protein CbpA
MNPYEILGVRRNASLKTMKAAYRSRAKACHPDSPGGSAEDFHALHTAWQILSDPARRLAFDRTGRVESAGGDNARSEILSAAFQAMEAALSRIRDHQRDPLRCDVVREMAILTRDQLRQRRVEYDQVVKLAAFYRSLLGRFRRQDGGPSEFEGMIASKLVDVDRQLHACLHRIEVLKATLALIEEHAFRADAGDIALTIAIALDSRYSGATTL